MKRALAFSILALGLLTLGVPQAASAKAATVIMTVLGRQIPWAFAITEPKSLEHSNVWLGNFLDSNRMNCPSTSAFQKKSPACDTLRIITAPLSGKVKTESSATPTAHGRLSSNL
jgi:hypothetical protein